MSALLSGSKWCDGESVLCDSQQGSDLHKPVISGSASSRKGLFPYRPDFLWWEYPVAAVLIAALTAVIAWIFILHPRYSATMPEYIFKFLPALLDEGIVAAFDFVGIGDPRPRVFPNLLALANIKFRGLLYESHLIHPSLSVNWLIYPSAVLLFFRAAVYITGSRRTALMTSSLYAVSPAALDTLVNYYIPAKPLASLCMIAALYGAGRMAPHPESGHSPRPHLGATVVFAAILVGLLSDETMFFVFLFLPALFPWIFFTRKPCNSATISLFLALAGSALIYGWVAFVVLPMVNVALDQVPLDFYTLLWQGVYRTYFIYDATSSFADFSKYSPLALLAVIVSAHAIPLRIVTDFWTRNSPLESFWQWHEVTSLIFFCAAMIFAICYLEQTGKSIFRRLLVALFIFIFVQAILIFPVAPWIVEVNYYATYSSILFAMIAGLLLGGLKADPGFRAAGWLLLVYLFATSLTNFVETAQRHPAFDKTDLTWNMLDEAKRKVRETGFEQAALAYPYPSRIFGWIFEYEAHRLHARGVKVDLVKMGRPSDTLYGKIDINLIADPLLVSEQYLFPQNEEALLKLGATRIGDKPLSREQFIGQIMEGATGPWNYERRVGEDGQITARVWHTGLMRLWAQKGQLIQRADGICMNFEGGYTECWSRLYRFRTNFYGIAPDGKVVTRFTRRE